MESGSGWSGCAVHALTHRIGGRPTPTSKRSQRIAKKLRAISSGRECGGNGFGERTMVPPQAYLGYGDLTGWGYQPGPARMADNEGDAKRCCPISVILGRGL